MTELTLTRVNLTTRWQLHLLPLVAVIFLSFYGKVVCPFIDTLTLSRVMLGLGIVCVIQILLREGFARAFPKARSGTSLARHIYHLSIASWLITGLVAVVLHMFMYPDFPIVSHGKLLAGYWALGAGILSQLEYIRMEQYFRIREDQPPTAVLEHITKRLMEGYATFAIVPAFVMILMAYRFVYEGYAVLGVALEVTFLGISFVAAALFVAWRYGMALRRDCDHIVKALEMVTAGYYEVRVDASRGDELGRVADGINDMAKGLVLREQIRESFGRFVTPRVAEQFIQEHSGNGREIQLGGHRREVAILIADLRGFTPLSEILEPEALTELLNEYFGEMVAAIDDHGGMVDKFMGDAVMAVFGLFDDGRNSAADAIATAIEMRSRLATFNEGQRADKKTRLDNGIGIHFGEVVAGYIGSADRLEFTIIGPAVNIAARIESETKSPNPPILISASVVENAGKIEGVNRVGTFKLKGVTDNIDLYSVTTMS